MDDMACDDAMGKDRERDDETERDDPLDLLARQAGRLAYRVENLAKESLSKLSQLSQQAQDFEVDQLLRRSDKPGKSAAANTGKILIRSVGRKVVLLADPAIPSYQVSGPHYLHKDGSVTEIIAQAQWLTRGEQSVVGAIMKNVDSLARSRSARELVVTLNPHSDISVEVSAAKLVTKNLPRIRYLRLSLGSVSCEGVEQIDDGLIQAGLASLEGNFRGHPSRLRAESARMNIHLGAEADLIVHCWMHAATTVWPDGFSGQDRRMCRIGQGVGSLDLSLVASKAQLHLSEENPNS